MFKLEGGSYIYSKGGLFLLLVMERIVENGGKGYCCVFFKVRKEL